MANPERLQQLLRQHAGSPDAVAEHLQAHPGHTDALVDTLTCGDPDMENAAAVAVSRVAETSPRLLEPQLRRLFRVCANHDRKTVRLAMAEALPQLELGPGLTGRLAFVFESWLDETDGDLKRAGMTALVALVPQRPSLAPRIRREIERRAATGSPAAAGHGRDLLRHMREF